MPEDLYQYTGIPVISACIHYIYIVNDWSGKKHFKVTFQPSTYYS